MDTSKPAGDACREDGTLKDAREMVWPNSPTGINPALIEDLSQHGVHSSNGSDLEPPNSSESEPHEAPKAKVRYII
jgi:hypothetical protein